MKCSYSSVAGAPGLADTTGLSHYSSYIKAGRGWECTARPSVLSGQEQRRCSWPRSQGLGVLRCGASGSLPGSRRVTTRSNRFLSAVTRFSTWFSSCEGRSLLVDGQAHHLSYPQGPTLLGQMDTPVQAAAAASPR